MRYAKQNALLHRQRIEAQEQRKMDEHVHRIRQEEPVRLNGTGDPLVVPTAPLAEVLNKWREWYELEHDWSYDRGDAQNRDKARAFGPVQYLEEQSGLNRRQVFRVMRQESKFTSLTKAEMILEAIDRGYMLKNGEIPVVPNPFWKYETWIEWMQQQGCET